APGAPQEAARGALRSGAAALALWQGDPRRVARARRALSSLLLLSADIRILDDLCVFRHLGLDIARENLAAGADPREAEFVQPRLHVRHLKDLADLRLQELRHVGRQAARPPQPIPGDELESL